MNQRHEEEAREHEEEREKWREEAAAKLSDKDRVRYNYYATMAHKFSRDANFVNFTTSFVM